MSEINELRKQFQNGNWKKFIKSVNIGKLRGWDNQTINFRFPVCVIVGENGSGKSSVLRAAACAYQNTLPNSKTLYPSRLFPDTTWDSTSVQGGTKLTYLIEQGNSNNTPIECWWKKTKDWAFTPKGKQPKRNVVFLDISRTLPLDATVGYAKIANKAIVSVSDDTVIADELLREYSHIMGVSYSSAKFIHPQANRNIGLLTSDLGQISQFHQGAGEDTLLDLMRILQTIPETSLLIIDEIESALHPKAQRRLVQFLIRLARQKKLQIIISTHSPYILNEIPNEGRILIQKLHDGSKEVQYGISTNYAMGVIDDDKHPDLYIYVEDKESKTLLYEILKRDESIFTRIEIRDVGDCEVVKTLGKLCRNDKLPDKGIAVLDGDAGVDPNKNCLSLPSNKAPEKLIFDEMKASNWNNLDNRFGQGAGKLYAIFEDAVSCPNHHNITSRIGDSIHKSKDAVWDIFVEEWCRQCLDENYPNYVNELLIKIRNVLPCVDE